MANRTFGWIQNPGDLSALKRVVGVFIPNSSSHNEVLKYKLPLLLHNNLIKREDYTVFVDVLGQNPIQIEYTIAKGKGCGSGPRANALCSGIIQAALNGQQYKNLTGVDGKSIRIKKPYSDDWTTDGFLRWAVSTGLLEYDRTTDTLVATELGKELVQTEDGSAEEKQILSKALLSYPAVYRVLKLLSDGNAYTKFEIGNKLGFEGEMGFTSIPQEIYVYDFCSAATTTERTAVRSNLEGDSDKYARMICNWMVKLGWVSSTEKEVTETAYGMTYTATLAAWKITREGAKAIVLSDGNSSNPKIPKIVKFEMLATKCPDVDYIRLRRALILNNLKNEKSLSSLVKALADNGIDESEDAVKDDIKNFERIGLNISCTSKGYKLTDKIEGLDIPVSRTAVSKGDVTKVKDNVRKQLSVLDHKYLILIDLAYSDADSRAKKNADAKQFEIETANLFSKELGYRSERLGDSNKPDVLIEYDNFGIIVDNKSYKDGFNLSASVRREMADYIEQNDNRTPGIPTNEWWKWFSPAASTYAFLFVTSFLTGSFKDSLDTLHTMKGINGGAIGVENLLYLAEKIKSGKMDKSKLLDIMANDEITISM